MKDIFKIKWGFIFLIILGLGCGELGTGVSNPPTNPSDKAASAVAALFSSSSETSLNLPLKIPSLLLDLVVKRALADHEEGHAPDGSGQECTNDPGCTCTFVASGERGDDQVDDSLYLEVDGSTAFGSTARSITVDEDDFCTQPDGTTNTGSGPDGRGRFAGFTLAKAVVGSCGSTTITMKSGSTGIWRNTEASGDTPAYQPEVYGTFIMSTEDVESRFNCTLFLGGNEEFLYANCSDVDTGEEVTQDVDTSCSFSTDG